MPRSTHMAEKSNASKWHNRSEKCRLSLKLFFAHHKSDLPPQIFTDSSRDISCRRAEDLKQVKNTTAKTISDWGPACP